MEQHEREIIVREIKRWQEQGLLPLETCQKLLDIYSQPPLVPAPQGVVSAPQVTVRAQPGATTGTPPIHRTSIDQLLLSETAVNTALYLGGFFIIVAAFIVAALIAEARLPILITATVIFLGGSLFTLRRLRQASLVFFLIGSLLILIDAQVISGMLELKPPAVDLFWALACLLASLFWAGGFILFRTWIISSLAFLGAVATVLMTTNWLEGSDEWKILALSFVMLCGVLVAVRLGPRFGNRLILPLIILSQIGEFIIICLLLYPIAISSSKPPVWILLAAGWLVGVFYYSLSDWVIRRWVRATPFTFAVAFCSGVFPLSLLGSVSPDANQVAWVAFAWGLILSLVAEWFLHRRVLPMKFYGYAFYSIGTLLFFVAVITQMALKHFVDGEAYLLVFGLLYLVMHLRQPRWWLWSLALLAFSLMYFNLFLSGPLEKTSLSAGAIFLIPALVFLSLVLLIDKGWIFPRKEPVTSPTERFEWQLPALVFAGLYWLIDMIILLSNFGKDWPAQIFVVYTLYFAVYVVLKSKPNMSVLATGNFALAVIYSLFYTDADKLLSPMLLLAVLYCLAGVGMTFFRRTRRWSEAILWSGLGLGLLAAFFAPSDRDPFTILGVTLIAVFYAVEGWRKRAVWYGLPACLVFYLAYLTALLQLDIRQPQYYSIGAAALGIVMHNFFLRSKGPSAAFVTGVITILILLSTTFIQLVQSEELRYFLLLFFEALLLLGYGLLMRSRSFFFLPIVFLVLATIVVVVTVLSGVPTAIIIGCTGLLLLGLGVLALLMRERLIKVSERVGERFRIW